MSMVKNNAFAELHPIANFTYFAFVLFFGMSIINPVCQGISLVCAFAFAVRLSGRRAVMFGLKASLPVMLIAAIVNPAFNHAGVTLLCYFPTGNPLTLESLLYGLSAGAMLGAMLLWFMCLSSVFTSDKFIYLFGKIIPALSLLLSMTLRFVPKFRRQLETTAQAQAALGRDVSSGGILRRTRSAITVFSCVVTWALENSIETADSMKSRGYGLKGRTAFSIYRFRERDGYALGFILFCGITVFCTMLCGGLSFRYFPSIRGAVITPFTVFAWAAYFLLCAVPVIIDIREEAVWKSLRSEI